MRKKSLFFLVALLSVFGMTAKAADRICPTGAELNKFILSATTAYTYNSVTYSTANGNAVQDLDVVIVSGACNWSAMINGLPISVTVKADPLLSTRPIITYTNAGTAGYFIKPAPSTGKTIVVKFEGVDIVGTSLTPVSATGFLNSPPTAVGSNTKLIINNCVLRQFAVGAFISTYTANTAGGAPFEDLIITNSRIIGFGYLTNGTTANTSPVNIVLTNNYFGTYGNALSSFIKSGGSTVQVDHCTFNNVGGGSRTLFASTVSVSNTINNCVFQSCAQTTNNTISPAATGSGNINLSSSAFAMNGIPGTIATSPALTNSALPVVASLDPNDSWYYASSGTAGYYSLVTDAIAPTAPSGLSNSTPTTSSFTLSWTASTDAVGVTGYDVYKDAVYYGTTATTSLDITSLSASTAYSMTVKAKDAASNISAASSALVVTTAAPIADNTAPSIPAGLGNTTPTTSSFTLSWTASTDAVGVTGYDVYKDAVFYGSSATTSLDITSLSASTAYSMTVKAKDAANNISDFSGALVVNTAAADVTAPTVPTGLGNTTPTTSSFTLSWTASTDAVGVTAYDVYKDAVYYGTTATTSLAINSLTSNTAYSMTVLAKDAASNSSAESTALVVTTAAADITAPSIPNGLTNSTPAFNAFTLSWTASTDDVAVTSYDVYKNDVLYGNTAGTSLNITGLLPTTAYNMTVVAKDAAANASAASSVLVVTTATPTVWQIAAGTNPYLTYSNAGFISGDIIELTTSGGAYTWGTGIGSLTKSFTLRAAAGLAAKPIVTLPTGAFIGTSNNTDAQTVTLSGIEFNGNAGCTSISTPKAAAGGGFNIAVSDCEFRNFAAATKFFAYSTNGTGWLADLKWYGALTVANCKFFSPFTSVAYYSASYGGASVTSFTNCYIEGGTGTVLGNLAGNSNSTVSYTVDHCTFNNAGGATGGEFAVKNGGTSTTIVKNSIFANNPGGDVTKVTTVGTNPGNAANLNNGVFYLGSAPVIGTKYPTALLGSYLTTNPELDTDGFAITTAYLSGPADGKPRGFYNTSTSPWISLSTASISTLGYNGVGPDAVAKSFKVGGINLTADVTVTPSANFEISQDGTLFTTNPIVLTATANTVASTTIYIRVVASLSPNTYNGTVTLTSTNAVTKTLTLTGTVTEPTITLSSYALGQYDYFTGLGPSPQQLVTINATTLKGNLTVTAPSNFEISATSGTGFSTNDIVVTPDGTGAIVDKAIYVRMAAGLSPATYTGNVTYTSVGATTKTTSVVGGVTNQPTMSVSNYYGLDYMGNGPSNQQKIVVEGGGLTSDITISLPLNSNFEMSTTEGGAFTPTNPIILTQIGGIVTYTPIYVQLKAGLFPGTYSDILTLTSTGSNTISAVLNGSSNNGVMVGAPKKAKATTPTILKVTGNSATDNQSTKGVTVLKVIVQ